MSAKTVRGRDSRRMDGKAWNEAELHDAPSLPQDRVSPGGAGVLQHDDDDGASSASLRGPSLTHASQTHVKVMPGSQT